MSWALHVAASTTPAVMTDLLLCHNCFVASACVNDTWRADLIAHDTQTSYKIAIRGPGGMLPDRALPWQMTASHAVMKR